MPRCLVWLPQCFHMLFSLDCYWRKSILKAMMTQQQATQGLFRSPGEKKLLQVQHHTVNYISLTMWRENNEDLPILAHFQKIPRSLKDKIIKVTRWLIILVAFITMPFHKSLNNRRVDWSKFNIDKICLLELVLQNLKLWLSVSQMWLLGFLCLITCVVKKQVVLCPSFHSSEIWRI